QEHEHVGATWLRTDLALHALGRRCNSRPTSDRLVHHSDRGVLLDSRHRGEPLGSDVSASPGADARGSPRGTHRYPSLEREVHNALVCATPCTVRTAEETVMRSVVVVLVGTLSRPAAAGAQHDRGEGDDPRRAHRAHSPSGRTGSGPRAPNPPPAGAPASPV